MKVMIMKIFPINNGIFFFFSLVFPSNSSKIPQIIGIRTIVKKNTAEETCCPRIGSKDKEVTHAITDFSNIDNIDSLKQTINSLTFNQSTGLYEVKPKESVIKQFVNKLKRFF